MTQTKVNGQAPQYGEASGLQGSVVAPRESKDSPVVDRTLLSESREDPSLLTSKGLPYAKEFLAARESMERDFAEYVRLTEEANVALGAMSGSSANSKDKGSCFSKACTAAGVPVSGMALSVMDLSVVEVSALASKVQFKVAFVIYGSDDHRNHIDLVHADATNAHTRLRAAGKFGEDRTFVVTNVQQFFNKSNAWAQHRFYADVDTSATGTEGFGGDVSRVSGATQPRVAGYARPSQPQRADSVYAESVHGGSSNVSGGVSRTKRRTFAATRGPITGPVAKNYRVSAAVKFNNFDELFQDTISREFAQDIIEDLFDNWGIPTDQPDAMKFAEDILFAFLIATTASNKADYGAVYPVPVKPIDRDGVTITEVDADFAVFSKLLESKHGVTRRQFARGVADDQRAYLKNEDNIHLLPTLANRVGCEVGLAHLAFDGSTHCTGMTTREQSYTRVLESRNLFERDDIVAQGASERLMQGLSGGVRSVAPR